MATDVAIVGGGMVGASLAVALRGTGLTVALIEAHP
jgi:2-polyprenyl-6-methoxyphenol hydroxylase-like FAD-dependent oxidoreductase